MAIENKNNSSSLEEISTLIQLIDIYTKELDRQNIIYDYQHEIYTYKQIESNKKPFCHPISVQTEKTLFLTLLNNKLKTLEHEILKKISLEKKQYKIKEIKLLLENDSTELINHLTPELNICKDNFSIIFDFFNNNQFDAINYYLKEQPYNRHNILCCIQDLSNSLQPASLNLNKIKFLCQIKKTYKIDINIENIYQLIFEYMDTPIKTYNINGGDVTEFIIPQILDMAELIYQEHPIELTQLQSYIKIKNLHYHHDHKKQEDLQNIIVNFQKFLLNKSLEIKILNSEKNKEIHKI